VSSFGQPIGRTSLRCRHPDANVWLWASLGNVGQHLPQISFGGQWMLPSASPPCCIEWLPQMLRTHPSSRFECGYDSGRYLGERCKSDSSNSCIGHADLFHGMHGRSCRESLFWNESAQNCNWIVGYRQSKWRQQKRILLKLSFRFSRPRTFLAGASSSESAFSKTNSKKRYLSPNTETGP
jgi:hypothetical protein